MFRLIEHPDPDAVTRHDVRTHFIQRLVLTASVCHELSNAPGRGSTGHRPQAALYILSWWMRTVYDLPESSWIDYAHCLDHPRLAEFASDLKLELEAGSQVCAALRLALSCDKDWELAGDLDRIRDRLDEYLALVESRKEGQ